jgi:hypothetical protein
MHQWRKQQWQLKFVILANSTRRRMSTTGSIVDNTLYETIVEGQASMLYEKTESVFYNKVQVII